MRATSLLHQRPRADCTGPTAGRNAASRGADKPSLPHRPPLNKNVGSGRPVPTITGDVQVDQTSLTRGTAVLLPSVRFQRPVVRGRIGEVDLRTPTWSSGTDIPFVRGGPRFDPGRWLHLQVHGSLAQLVRASVR